MVLCSFASVWMPRAKKTQRSVRKNIFVFVLLVSLANMCKEICHLKVSSTFIKIYVVRISKLIWGRKKNPFEHQLMWKRYWMFDNNYTYVAKCSYYFESYFVVCASGWMVVRCGMINQPQQMLYELPRQLELAKHCVCNWLFTKPNFMVRDKTKVVCQHIFVIEYFLCNHEKIFAQIFHNFYSELCVWNKNEMLFIQINMSYLEWNMVLQTLRHFSFILPNEKSISVLDIREKLIDLKRISNMYNRFMWESGNFIYWFCPSNWIIISWTILL